jgi:hypothetical protein
VYEIDPPHLQGEKTVRLLVMRGKQRYLIVLTVDEVWKLAYVTCYKFLGIEGNHATSYPERALPCSELSSGMYCHVK